MRPPVNWVGDPRFWRIRGNRPCRYEVPHRTRYASTLQRLQLSRQLLTPSLDGEVLLGVGDL